MKEVDLHTAQAEKPSSAAQSHTPGPWDWEARGVDGQAHIYLTDATCRKIGTLWGRPEEKIANAHLIRSAPTMLDVCRLAAELNFAEAAVVRDFKKFAVAAVALATGQPSDGSS